MNKKLIAIAVAGALSVPMVAQAADVNGYAVVDWTLADDSYETTNAGGSGINAHEGQFDAMAEIDFAADGVRVDIDATTNAVSLEQANFTTEIATGWNMTAGIFNSGLTTDAQDAPDMDFVSHNLVFDLYDGVNLINVAGLAFSGMAGPANVTVAYVNDPTITATTTVDAGNAVVVAASGSVMDGLDVGVSLVSADATDLTNFNIAYTMDALTAGLDYATSDVADAYSVSVGYDLGNGMDVSARIDNAEEGTLGNDGDTVDTTTLHFGYHLSDSVTVALENMAYKAETAAGATTSDYSTTTVEFIATF